MSWPIESMILTTNMSWSEEKVKKEKVRMKDVGFQRSNGKVKLETRETLKYQTKGKQVIISWSNVKIPNLQTHWTLNGQK